MTRIVVYADGGCSPNPGPGGWGVVISGPDGPLDLCGGEISSTNNRMELTAAIRALEHFPEGAQIEMRCDSQYVVKSVTEWMGGWKDKGWQNSKGPVKNLDLMQRLDELASQRDVKWTWVQGHSGDPLNERADCLATQGRHRAHSLSAQPSSSPSPAVKVPVATLPPVMSRLAMAAFRPLSILVDFSLAREVSHAAKQSGTQEAVFLEECIRFVLALGPEETARLRASMGAASGSAG
ncbi:ribonuclease HI [Methylobacterium sp. WL64]|uniref:ribonuclease HI n=1 Tax=Methylobacterium sp. WL64 TaxID=2603894 RepID=UPI0011CB5600|nr:ribonuclease HI [Methylobacterium sp. WL64]TXN02585.1 ribonuclease HI [Methylobacterium sp. WL64]